jgi:hypothetical protein
MEEVRGAFRSSEEITLKAVNEMPYLKAVIDESLRIFPVASYITPRVTPKGGHVIDGDVIPGGVSLVLFPSMASLSMMMTDGISVLDLCQLRSMVYGTVRPLLRRPERVPS